MPSTQPHCTREGASWDGGLDLPPPSGFAHIVKHRGPAVTVDHIPSKARF